MAGAVVILALKFGAYLVTGSVGLLSDAAESLVNLVAAVVLTVAVGVAAAPPDYKHPYGHTKAEYLSSVLEAALIILAAGVIGLTAVRRLLEPQPLDQVGLGLSLAGVAAVVNGALALRLLHVARRERSDALEANARHLVADVLTSVGTVLGVALVRLTGWLPLDPLVALVVAGNIVVTGVSVMRRSLSRLLDERLPEPEEARVIGEIEGVSGVLGYHRLRTRRSGSARFAEVDVFVDGDMRVEDAHEVAREVERRVRSAVDGLEMTVHIEPFEEGVRDVSRSPREEFPEED
ncbi:MAG TPA: cation diffusion facilitator family transporter [Trueperaceae bacterium]|nr:cation diffusion facilitator family transporter [Trueperaceae bacterium]